MGSGDIAEQGADGTDDGVGRGPLQGGVYVLCGTRAVQDGVTDPSERVKRKKSINLEHHRKGSQENEYYLADRKRP